MTDLDAKNEDEVKQRYQEIVEKIRNKDKTILGYMTAGIEEVRDRLAKARKGRERAA